MPDKQISNLAALVGRNIVKQRRKLGMSQDQLAEQLNIASSSLSRIENGLSSPRFERLEALSDALKCPVANLFRDENESLYVRLEILEEMLKPLKPKLQNDVIYLVGAAIQMLKDVEDDTK